MTPQADNDLLSLSMNSLQLKNWIDLHGPVHITFSKNAINIECYPEEGIQAYLTKITLDKSSPDDAPEDLCCHWHLDYSPFEVLNGLHESSNYRDEAGKNTLRAYATSWYNQKDSVCIGLLSPMSTYVAGIVPGEHMEAPCDAVEKRMADIEETMAFIS